MRFFSVAAAVSGYGHGEFSHFFPFVWSASCVLRCVANVLETLLCLLLLRDDFSMRWRRLLLTLEGMGFFFGVCDRFDTMGAMALGGTTLGFRI